MTFTKMNNQKRTLTNTDESTAEKQNAIVGSEFRMSINGALEEIADLGILTLPVFERLQTCSLRILVRVNGWT